MEETNFSATVMTVLLSGKCYQRNPSLIGPINKGEPIEERLISLINNFVECGLSLISLSTVLKCLSFLFSVNIQRW